MHPRESREEYTKKRKRSIFKRYYIKWLDRLARFSIPSGLRILFYRMMGMKIGNNAFIGIDCMLDSSFPELIAMEDNVVLSFRVMIICHDDAKGLTDTSGRRTNRTVSKVELKKGCYIGAGAIILPGIVVGENAVVGAGAIVTKDVTPNTIVAGNPAKKMKEIKE